VIILQRVAKYSQYQHCMGGSLLHMPWISL